mmetsp:Transcript_47670/g.116901  ORF Transcript_47670/g.116901 Transcript_47670/m.116901 type:complete len:277 (+) Transcript_47670:67-897(+)
MGTGEPVVFFEHGLGGNSLDFVWMQRNVSQYVRTCSYDRSGAGRSAERGPLPRNSAAVAEDMAAVVDALGIQEMILVGHSMAGFNMRLFHRDHPEKVLGMVLVDPVNPNITDSCDPSETYPSPLMSFGLAVAEAGVLRLMRVLGLLTAFAPLSELPEEVQGEYYSNLIKVDYFRTRIDEFAVWGQSCTAVKDLSLEERTIDAPVTVVVPIEGIYTDDMAAAEEMVALGVNTTAKPARLVVVDDPEVDHVAVVFVERFAAYATEAIHDMLALLSAQV